MTPKRIHRRIINKFTPLKLVRGLDYPSMSPGDLQFARAVFQAEIGLIDLLLGITSPAEKMVQTFTISVINPGFNRLVAIKGLREIIPGLTLGDAKNIVDGVFEGRPYTAQLNKLVPVSIITQNEMAKVLKIDF